MSEIGVSYMPRSDREAEARLFVRDALDHDGTGRLEIDPFRFKRYVALGWIREIETRPYYQLTPNGEEIYWPLVGEVQREWWRELEEDDDDEE